MSEKLRCNQKKKYRTNKPFHLFSRGDSFVMIKHFFSKWKKYNNAIVNEIQKNIYSFIEKIQNFDIFDFESTYQTSLYYNKRWW